MSRLNFNDALFTYCKARNDADIDLTASDGVSILYTFLHNNFYDDFNIAYHETWLNLIAGNKKSSDSKWVSRFKDIKLLDNQIIYLRYAYTLQAQSSPSLCFCELTTVQKQHQIQEYPEASM